MSIDIDMESYAGEQVGPAAGGQQVVDTNIYQTEMNDAFEGLPYVEDQSLKNEVDSKTEAHPQSEHFKALREEVDRLKADRERERREHDEQMAMIRANLAPKPEVQKPQVKPMFEGMSDQDIPNVSEIRQEWGKKEAEYLSRIEELQVAQSYPDYAEVLQKYAGPLVKDKPNLIAGVLRADNKALALYELGKMQQQLIERPTVQETPRQSETAQRIVDNSRKPGTLSQAGGQGALSKADYIATMSDAEFVKFASKHLESI